MSVRLLPPEISDFHGEYFFLSNFYPSPVEFCGREFPTVENAFQAAKTKEITKLWGPFYTCSPGEAKRLGRKLELRDDWDNIKDGIMESLLRKKFKEDTLLARKLIATSTVPLIEGNTWGDKYWGCVKQAGEWMGSEYCWVGKNKLGLILMDIRDTLRRAEKEKTIGRYFL